MNHYIWLVLGLVAALFINSLIAVVTSKSRWARVVIVVIFFGSLVGTFIVPFELLGRAKPAEWAWIERKTEEAEIRGVELREGEGIYLMLIVDNEPRLYVFPWNQKMAENIQQAMAEAQAQGTSAVLGKPFRNGGPIQRVADAIDRLLGRGGGEQQGREGRPGEGEAGNFNGGVEEREPPMAYPKPREALPPKPPEQGGVRYDRDKK